ncbi:hypothetical protein GTR04_5901 [Trichophyton interdigitale]|nr:hypothetical protein GY631_2204 [Trichophyton interdigitale]KAG5218312.1 hypothetical protein GY632_5677 [Trichophyton interdigitale]KAG8206723.1 hypothetical protein GTR04_5901 [Trichophyton interdigitale]
MEVSADERWSADKCLREMRVGRRWRQLHIINLWQRRIIDHSSKLSTNVRNSISGEVEMPVSCESMLRELLVQVAKHSMKYSDYNVKYLFVCVDTISSKRYRLNYISGLVGESVDEELQLKLKLARK